MESSDDWQQRPPVSSHDILVSWFKMQLNTIEHICHSQAVMGRLLAYREL